MKNLSVLAAFCALPAIGALSLAPAPVAAQNTSPPEYMEMARSLLQELVEINTTDTERGDNTVAARAAARVL